MTHACLPDLVTNSWSSVQARCSTVGRQARTCPDGGEGRGEHACEEDLRLLPGRHCAKLFFCFVSPVGYRLYPFSRRRK